jgi:dipeptidyl aminopeptidase/acylaminoacyl peptidase
MDDRDAGRPARRVGEIAVPVLLAHGDRDIDVFPIESLTFARLLERAEKRWQLVRYDQAEHDIQQPRYRTDLLARLGEFLDEHTAE